MNRRHMISIAETDESVTATIMDLYTGATLSLQRLREKFSSRDEMIGDLFSGDLPNIRDCYDSDAWVRQPERD